MKVRLALIAALALPLGLSAMPTAVEYLPARLSLPQAVKLADGSVLPAGKYDVQINYKGFGNAAEFVFLQGGAPKGKCPAEARGFPSQAPAGVGGGSQTVKIGDIKGESTEKDHKAYTVKMQPADPILQKGVGDPSAAKVFPKVEDKSQVPNATQAFSWGAHGFNAGTPGKTAQAGQSLKISFDSANSSAGFSALLPYVEKKKMK
jgi:hypothetical protein